MPGGTWRGERCCRGCGVSVGVACRCGGLGCDQTRVCRQDLGEQESSCLCVCETAGNVCVSPWAGLWRCLLARGVTCLCGGSVSLGTLGSLPHVPTLAGDVAPFPSTHVCLLLSTAVFSAAQALICIPRSIANELMDQAEPVPALPCLSIPVRPSLAA